MSWKIYKLWDFLTESKIFSEKSDSNNRITVRLNVKWVEKRPDRNDVKWATKYFIRSKWQFIYWKQNLHKWAFWIIPDDLDWYETTSDIPTFDINTNICLPDMLMYFFKQNDYYKSLEWLAKWVWSKRIHPAQIFDLEIYLPSIDIQKKILFKSLLKESKIQDLLKIIDENIYYIKQLKQAILQEAIEWKLTKSWRKNNPNIESASKLLEKIQKEKEELIKQKKLKKQEKLKEISENEIPFVIPENWIFEKLIEVSFITKLAWFEYTKYINLKEKWDIPVIRAQNVRKWYIDDRNLLYIDSETSNNLQRSALYKKCLLMTFIWAWIWDTAIFDKDIRFHLAPNVAKIEIFNNFNLNILEEYLELYLLSETWRQQIFWFQKWWAQPNLSMAQIRQVIFPLPPLEEQKEIVKKVDELMSYCDLLEKQSLETKENSENLMKSVLSEVFSR